MRQRSTSWQKESHSTLSCAGVTLLFQKLVDGQQTWDLTYASGASRLKLSMTCCNFSKTLQNKYKERVAGIPGWRRPKSRPPTPANMLKTLTGASAVETKSNNHATISEPTWKNCIDLLDKKFKSSHIIFVNAYNNFPSSAVQPKITESMTLAHRALQSGNKLLKWASLTAPISGTVQEAGKPHCNNYCTCFMFHRVLLQPE